LRRTLVLHQVFQQLQEKQLNRITERTSE
jgi:hypothetical protein